MKLAKIVLCFLLLSCSKEKSNQIIFVENEEQENFAYPKYGLDSLYRIFSLNISNPNNSTVDTLLYQVDFIVDIDGNITPTNFTPSISPEFDSLISQLLINSGPWVPAMAEGKPVSSNMKLPFAFSPKED